MANLELSSVLQQIEGKMEAELKDGHNYEALQYVQSFVARKKKNLGQQNTSSVVFHGARQLVASNASLSAGVLLKWFIEEGAGSDYSFLLSMEKISNSNYCDVQRVVDLLTGLNAEQGYPIVDAIYDPLHLVVAKLKIKKSEPMLQRLNKFEELCAKIYLEHGAFYHSFKCYLRLNKMQEAANALLQWSAKGYASEKPLFFARGVLYLLSEGKVSAANELLTISQSYVIDNIGTEGTVAGNGGGAESAPLAVWHLATILTELAAMPTMPRVDKTKLFGILYSRYGSFLVQYDTKLLEILTKAGEAVFGFSIQAQQQGRSGAPAPANPMAMLQGLLGGGAGNNAGAAAGKAGAPAMDMDKMMSMMSRLQGGR